MNKVTCIAKPDRSSKYDAIQKLGGTKDADGGQWSCTRQECVDFIKKGYKFYVNVSGHKVYLITQKSAGGLIRQD